MYAFTPAVITAYLLIRLMSVATMAVIVFAIACPLVWSGDATRRARARDALLLLIYLITGRRIR